jgi:small-conductance mechanosensitive channel
MKWWIGKGFEGDYHGVQMLSNQHLSWQVVALRATLLQHFQMSTACTCAWFEMYSFIIIACILMSHSRVL